MFTWVQVLRGLAASIVVTDHYVGSQLTKGQAVNEWWNQFGPAGVDIFFVISGFIMMYTQLGASEKFSAESFLIKRLIRIAPLFWLLTTVAFALPLLMPSVNSIFTVQQYVSSMFFLPYSSASLIMSADAFKAYILPMSWTLTFEWYFYLVFACVMSLNASVYSRLGLMFMWFFLCTVTGYLLQPQSLILQVITSPLVFEFLMGSVIAGLYIYGMRIQKWILLPVSLLCLFILSNNYHHSIYERVMEWGLASFVLVSCATLFEAKKDNLVVIRPFAWLGDMSYSLYLSHFFTIAIFVRLQNKFNLLQDGFSIVTLVMFIFLSLLISWSCYHLIENPSRKYFSEIFTNYMLVKKIRR